MSIRTKVYRTTKRYSDTEEGQTLPRWVILIKIVLFPILYARSRRSEWEEGDDAK